jgi:hypothetical protein
MEEKRIRVGSQQELRVRNEKKIRTQTEKEKGKQRFPAKEPSK